MGRRGIIRWERIPLGLKPDKLLAERLGVNPVTVWRARKRLGIQHPRVAWDEQPLGKFPDGVIAAQLGVSAAAVQRARSQRGISSCRVQRGLGLVGSGLIEAVYASVSNRFTPKPSREIALDVQESFQTVSHRQVQRCLAQLLREKRIRYVTEGSSSRDWGYVRSRK